MTANSSSGTAELTSAQRILERTIQVIETSGEAAIRTNPIAFECGVTPPILYRAFGNREGLIIAAQAERYRRSNAQVVAYLCDVIAQANSRDQLIRNVTEMLRLILTPERAASRRLRVEVIGSSVSRPQLRALIAEIDKEYAQAISSAYQPAVENGWISRDKNLKAIALWAHGMVNTRYMFDEGDVELNGATWNELTISAILSAIFD